MASRTERYGLLYRLAEVVLIGLLILALTLDENRPVDRSNVSGADAASTVGEDQTRGHFGGS
jgi:hypothetical protein